MSSSAHPVARWLRDQIVPLVNVQRCAFGQAGVAADPVRDVDLVVHTWTGIAIHIHLISAPIKPPKVRRILENATNSGIPSLFILDARLLPRPGQREPADRWYVPLQALGSERVYAFQQGSHTPLIVPVQFRAVSRIEVEPVYGAPVPIRQIRHFRATVRHPALKGYWLLADFEGEAVARSGAARSTEIPHGPPQTPLSAAPRTPLEESYLLLGLTPRATRDEVRAAFRRLAFEVHPDVSELPKPEAEARFKRLNQAYEMIRTANKWP